MSYPESLVKAEIGVSPSYLKNIIQKERFKWSGDIDLDYIGSSQISLELMDIDIQDVSLTDISLELLLKINAQKTTGLLKGHVEVDTLVRGNINLIWDEDEFNKFHLDITNVDFKDDGIISLASIPISKDFIEKLLIKYGDKIDKTINQFITKDFIYNSIQKAVPNAIEIFTSPPVYFHHQISSIDIFSLSKTDNSLMLKGAVVGIGLINENKKSGYVDSPINIRKMEGSSGNKALSLRIDLSYNWLNEYIKLHVKLEDQLPSGVLIDRIIIKQGNNGLIIELTGDIKGISDLILLASIIEYNGLLTVQKIDAIDVQGQMMAKGLFNISKGFVLAKIKSVIDGKLQEFQKLLIYKFKSWPLYTVDAYGIGLKSSNVIVDKFETGEKVISVDIAITDPIIILK